MSLLTIFKGPEVQAALARRRARRERFRQRSNTNAQRAQAQRNSRAAERAMNRLERDRRNLAATRTRLEEMRAGGYDEARLARQRREVEGRASTVRASQEEFMAGNANGRHWVRGFYRRDGGRRVWVRGHWSQ